MKKLNEFKSKNEIIYLTNKALNRIKYLYLKKNSKLKLFVENKGCAGNIYNMKLILKKKKRDVEFVNFKNKLIILIKKNNINYFNKIILDFININFNKKFIFINSKIKEKCNCGNSFKLK